VAVCFQQAAPLAHTTSPMTAPCAGTGNAALQLSSSASQASLLTGFSSRQENGASLCTQLQHFYACLIDQSGRRHPLPYSVQQRHAAVHRSQFDSVASLVWVLGSSTTIIGAVPLQHVSCNTLEPP
jgi:hypothetical protein